MNLQEMLGHCQLGLKMFHLVPKLEIQDDAIEHAVSGISLRKDKIPRKSIAKTVYLEGWVVERTIFGGLDPEDVGPDFDTVAETTLDFQAIGKFLSAIFDYYALDYANQLALDAAVKELET